MEDVKLQGHLQRNSEQKTFEIIIQYRNEKRLHVLVSLEIECKKYLGDYAEILYETYCHKIQNN